MKSCLRWAILLFVFVFTSEESKFVHAAPVSGQGNWETMLQGRDLDGNLSTFEAYYDTTRNITWLADANYAQTSGFHANGFMNWTSATAWAASLNPYDSGITGWRLPITVDEGNDGCTAPNVFQGVDCRYNISVHSEMSHMFYVTLGNKAYFTTSGVGPQPGWGLTNTGPFSNLGPSSVSQNNIYWSATEYPQFATAWFFSVHDADQNGAPQTANFLAWAVHAGDVGASTVPLPAATWLFASGLIALLGLGHKLRR